MHLIREGPCASKHLVAKVRYQPCSARPSVTPPVNSFSDFIKFQSKDPINTLNPNFSIKIYFLVLWHKSNYFVVIRLH